MKKVREFRQIAAAENPELETLWQTIGDILDDQFIQRAAESGIARRETMLHIYPYADDDLESRRFRVLARWNDQLPYTYKVLQNKLNQLCGVDGYEIELLAGEYTLSIKIELTKKRMFQEVKEVSNQMIPANIRLVVELRYNQYSTLESFTHSSLTGYTHENLRNEVIES